MEYKRKTTMGEILKQNTPELRTIFFKTWSITHVILHAELRTMNNI